MQFKPFKIGKYLLLERLATGGMAEVYRAKASGAGGFEKQLAIKRIIPTYSENEEFRRMFEYEARLSSLLNHANIVHVYDFVKSADTYLLAMEFVDGKNLRQAVNKAKKLGISVPIGFSAFVINEVCKGLDYAHKMRDGYQGKHLNVIHRDMSPQNVMLGYEGAVKIVDFGIAKARDRVDETRSGVIKGKFGYMSPEQASGEEIDHRSDIFSTVIILYELITGKRLFAAENDMATLKRIQECIVPRPSLVNPKVNSTLEKIVLKGLTKEKDLRYQHAGELHQKLQEYLNRFHPTITQNSISAMMSNLFSQEIRQEKKRLEKVYQQSIPYSQGAAPPVSEDIDGIGQLLDGEQTKSEINPDSLITKVSNPSISVPSASQSIPQSKTDIPTQEPKPEPSVPEPTPAPVSQSASATLKADPPDDSVSTESAPPESQDTGLSSEKTAFAANPQDDLFTSSTIVPPKAETPEVKDPESKTGSLQQITEKTPEESKSEVTNKPTFNHTSNSFSLVTEAKRAKAREPAVPVEKAEVTSTGRFTIEPGNSYTPPMHNPSSEKAEGGTQTNSHISPTKPKKHSDFVMRKRTPKAPKVLGRFITMLVVLIALIGVIYVYTGIDDINNETQEVFDQRSPARSNAPLAPPTVPDVPACSVKIDSDPRGATAIVDGQAVGRTPIVRQLNCNNTAAIQIRLNGYRPYQKRIRVQQNKSIYTTLRKIPKGQVQLILSHNANLYVNGIRQNVTIPARKVFAIGLEAGREHRLKFVNGTIGVMAEKTYRLKKNQVLKDRVQLKNVPVRQPRTPTRIKR